MRNLGPGLLLVAQEAAWRQMPRLRRLNGFGVYADARDCRMALAATRYVDDVLAISRSLCPCCVAEWVLAMLAGVPFAVEHTSAESRALPWLDVRFHTDRWPPAVFAHGAAGTVQSPTVAWSTRRAHPPRRRPQQARPVGAAACECGDGDQGAPLRVGAVAEVRVARGGGRAQLAAARRRAPLNAARRALHHLHGCAAGRAPQRACRRRRLIRARRHRRRARGCTPLPWHAPPAACTVVLCMCFELQNMGAPKYIFSRFPPDRTLIDMPAGGLQTTPAHAGQTLFCMTGHYVLKG